MPIQSLERPIVNQLAVLCSIAALALLLPLHAIAACPWQKPQDLLLTSLDQATGTDAPLSTAAISEDLDCLKLIFEKQYMAELFYREKGLSLLGAVENLRATLTAPMSAETLTRQLIALHQGANDSHLSYSFKSEATDLREAQATYAIFAIDPASTKGLSIRACRDYERVPTLGDDGNVGDPLYVLQSIDQAPQPATCTLANGLTQSLPTKRLEQEALPQELRSFSFRTLESGILYVRIPSFTPGISPEQQELLDFLKDHDLPILFDLRQNEGGDSRFADTLAAVLRSQAETLPIVRMRSKDSLYSTASTLNQKFIGWKTREKRGHPDAVLYKEAYDRWMKTLTEQIASGHTLESLTFSEATYGGNPGLRKKAYSKPIVLLVDKGCASACEDMIAMFSGIPKATVIGTHSGGYLMFGNVGSLVLPHSRILVRTGWRNFEYPKAFAEGRGFSPDLYSVGTDSLASAIRFLLNN